MRPLAVLACLASLALGAGCGSDDGGGGYGSPAKSATTGQADSAAAAPLVACLEKSGMKVRSAAGGLTATGNGDTVQIRLFDSAAAADAFAKRQTADSTQAGNRVAVYGPDPKPKTVDAVESCLPET